MSETYELEPDLKQEEFLQAKPPAGPGRKNGNGKKRKPLLILSAVLLVAAIVGLIAYLLTTPLSTATSCR